jgi:hypothetical protein
VRGSIRLTAPCRCVPVSSDVRQQMQSLVSTTPRLPDEPDAQVRWFHDLAEEVRAGRATFNSTTRDSLGRFLGVFLPGHPLSGGETEGELGEVVRDVRENELAWNRSLQRAIVSSHDAFDAGNSGQAIGILEEFARKCSWTCFAQIALDQAALYSDGGPQ